MKSHLWFLTLLALPLTSPAANDLSKKEVGELREMATLLFGPLPDKMPGSENDTRVRVQLGRKLYHDKILSKNNSQSCNTCHRVDRGLGGVDNEKTSPGAFGKRGDRNAPTVLNAGFHLAQFWDGRAEDLKAQAKGPVLNPVEMAMPDEQEVLKRLRAHDEYPALFAQAFPNAEAPVTYDNMAEAIAAFERTLITRDRFDDWQKGDDKALTMAELKGLKLFMETGCTTCHVGPVLGANQFQKAGLVKPWPNQEDPGRFAVTKNEDDKLKFKVPSLRNIELTAPYFHDGSGENLQHAVRTMARHQLGRELTDAEAESLATFLKSLTDKKRGENFKPRQGGKKKGKKQQTD